MAERYDVVLDGQLGGATSQWTFPVYPILYPENSVHALSVLSLDRKGALHYSQGMAGTLILSDIWKDENKVESAPQPPKHKKTNM